MLERILTYSLSYLTCDACPMSSNELLVAVRTRKHSTGRAACRIKLRLSPELQTTAHRIKLRLSPELHICNILYQYVHDCITKAVKSH